MGVIRPQLDVESQGEGGLDRVGERDDPRPQPGLVVAGLFPDRIRNRQHTKIRQGGLAAGFRGRRAGAGEHLRHRDPAHGGVVGHDLLSAMGVGVRLVDHHARAGQSIMARWPHGRRRPFAAGAAGGSSQRSIMSQ